MEIIAVLILGWASGMVVNYLADILPYSTTFRHPQCHSCGAEKSLLAYFTFQKCQFCRQSPPIRVWVVIISGMVISFILWLLPEARLPYLSGFFLCMYLFLVCLIDIEHRLIIVNPLGIAGLILGGLYGYFLHGVTNTILGGLAGFGILFVLYLIGRIYTRWITRKKSSPEVEDEALGYGDVLLAGILGLILGWPGITVGLLLGILFGGLFSLLYIMIMAITHRYSRNMAIPYAPFLIIGTVVLLYRVGL